jgi:hypothetical protein
VRERVCNLQRNHSLVRVGPVTTYYCLIWDSPNLEDQVPVFISPRNKVTQLYPRALGSLFAASYSSQGYGGLILTRLHIGRSIYHVQVQVQVILQPTVSWPGHLDVVPPLEQMTGFYIFWVTVTFFLSSCKAPSLTRGRVCNLHCNDASSSLSYIVTDGQSASWFVARDQILIFFLWHLLTSQCRAPSPISPMNRVVQPEVKIKSHSHFSVGRNF